MTAQGKHRSPSGTPRRSVSRFAVAAAAVIAMTVGVGAVVAVGLDAEPTAAEWQPRVSDSFEREAVRGWGSAPVGGKYALSAPQYFSVTDGGGVAAPPRSGSSLTASIESVSIGDVRALATARVPTIPERGNGVFVGVVARATATAHYLVTARLGTGGAIYLSILREVGSPAKQVALVRDVRAVAGAAEGAAIHIETEVLGESPVRIAARVWVGDGTVPEWQAEVTDDDAQRLARGGVGLWTYVSSGSPPQKVSFESLEAWERVKVAPSPTPTATNPPDEPSEPARGSPGAAPIGSLEVAVPKNAVFVASTGRKAAAGTEADPWGSIQAAITAARSGDTIVVREGSYHGSVILPAHKSLHLQPYPGEEVWLDGSRVVDEWERSGDAWVHRGWDVRFDASPTYSRGAPDGTKPGWQFVNPEFPMAAHPDQVWLGDEALRQVGSREAVKKGTFFVDYAAKALFVGSDPTSAQVRAADTVKALTISGSKNVVQGIGIRRFSPSVPDIGAVAISGKGVELRDVVITDVATTGLAIFSSDVSIVDVTITRSGMLGAQASTADRLTATGLLIADNNTEHFNRAPVSGGFKIHKSRGVEVSRSSFERNRGNGLWFDESVYDMTVTSNDIVDSIGNGLVIELSAKAVVADNIITGSERDGILVSDSGHVAIWNNTLSANDRSINIVQGTRRASNITLPGHDPRQPLPDPTVTWVTEDIVVSNNVLANGRGKCVLCVEDYSHERSAAQMRIRSNGNVLHRTSATQPKWVVVWSRGAGNPAVFTSVEAFAAATGNDVDSLALDAQPALVGTSLAPAVESIESAIAQPLPAGVAQATNRAAGERHLGAWE